MATSWFVNSTPLVAMLTPLLKQACRDMGEAPAQVLMPMNVAAHIGGTFAVIGTSTNLIYDGLMRAEGMGPMPFFEMIKVAGVPALVSLLGLVFLPKWLLPHKGDDLLRFIQKNASSFMAQMAVTDDSPLVGRQVSDLAATIPAELCQHVTLVEIIGVSGAVIAPPRPWDAFLAGDVLLFAGDVPVLKKLAVLLRLRWLPQVCVQPRHVAADMARLESRVNSVDDYLCDAASVGPEVQPSGEIDGQRSEVTVLSEKVAGSASSPASEEPLFVECVLSQRAQVLGQAVGSGAFQRRYGVSVLAMRKAGHVAAATSGDLRRCVLEVGDTLLVLGPASFVSRFEDEFLTAAIDDEHDDIAATLVDHFVIVPSWFPFGRTIDASVNIEHVETRKAAVGIRSLRQRPQTPLHSSLSALRHRLSQIQQPKRSAGYEPPTPVCMNRTSSNTELASIEPHNLKAGGPAAPTTAVAVVVADQAPKPDSTLQRSLLDDDDRSPVTSESMLRVVQIPHWYRYLAIVIFAAMMGTTIGGIDLIYCAAVAAFAMVLLKLVSVQQAFAEIDLEVMIMVCFSFGLGKGMEKSGLAAVIGAAINDAHISGFPLMLVIAFAAAVITNVITNKACAQVLFPVVVRVLRDQGRDPLGAVMVLAVITSCNLCTPYCSASNLIILGPGGYTTKDFVKFGLPLNIFLIVGVSFMGSLVYGDW